jgi:hypothetical protein
MDVKTVNIGVKLKEENEILLNKILENLDKIERLQTENNQLLKETFKGSIEVDTSTPIAI